MTINKLFIVGAGYMGAGIAQTAISCGFDVVLNDLKVDDLTKARDGIEKMLGRLVSKEKMSQDDMDAAMMRLTLSDSLSAAASADLVIEAVVEDASIKKAIFTKLSDICREDAIFATNTSSISITEIGSVVKNPGRFIGMHFFGPVPLMKLLELVKSLSTTAETVAAAKVAGERMGKVCIIAKDSPAFIVNRMLNPMINEAISLVEAGVASVEDIDMGMKSGLNHPMGPLELIDLAGIDIELAVMEVLYTETGDPKYRPATLLRNMVRMNWLGRKTGIGFYVYNADGTRTPNPNL